MTTDELKKIQQNFQKELKDADTGKKTSLPYILHQLPDSPLAAEDELFETMVVGGTIFRKALVKKSNGTVHIIRQEQKYQPPFHSKKDFLTFVDKEFYKDAKALALNFAYPMQPVFENGRLDGILLSGSKENTFGDLVGQKVALTLENHIQETFGNHVIVSVANDTICLLLSGLNEFSRDELAAGIVGTGLNFALFLPQNKMVNLEAANFDKFPVSPEAKEIDKTSAAPGKALLEKEVSGAYLYRHFNLIRQAKKLSTKDLHSTQELDQLAQMHAQQASYFAKEILINSANLTAAAIGGITLFQKKGLVFVVEGSLFWLADGYRQQIVRTLKELLPQHLQPKFVQINDSAIIGGAKLIS